MYVYMYLSIYICIKIYMQKHKFTLYIHIKRKIRYLPKYVYVSIYSSGQE